MTIRAFAGVGMKRIALSVSVLGLLTQSTAVYGQSADNTWWRSSEPHGSYIYIKNGSSNLCLGVVGVDTHPARYATPVEVYDCDPSGSDQGLDNQWSRINLNNGYYRIQNRVHLHLCLGVVGVDQHGPGARVEVYRCSPTDRDPLRDNQWKFDPVGSVGFETIQNRVSGLCLGVVGVNNHDPGARAEVYHCDR